MKKIYKKIVQWLKGFRVIELMAINILILVFAVGVTILNIVIRILE